MDFKNLRRNILAMLGESWRQTGAKGKFSLEPIRNEFSDIPENDLERHIDSLARNGYIELTEGGEFAELTPKGVDRLKVIETEKGAQKMVVAKELKSPAGDPAEQNSRPQAKPRKESVTDGSKKRRGL